MKRGLAVFLMLASVAMPHVHARATGVATLSAASLHYFPGDVDPAFATPLKVVQGSELYFAPADPLGNHSVTAVDTANGVPIFDSGGVIGPGQIAKVSGVASLPVGSYIFGCYVHDTMHGVLQIVAPV